MTTNIDSIIEQYRGRFIRMALEAPADLTDSECRLIGGLLNGWAEVAEMTEESSGLTEFGKVAKMLLGESNWQRIREKAGKFFSIENSGRDHGSSDTVVHDPHIATMSLQEHKLAASHLQRMGLDAGPVPYAHTHSAEVAAELADFNANRVPLLEALQSLLHEGKVSRSEYGEYSHSTTDNAKLAAFINNRKPLPAGTFRQ